MIPVDLSAKCEGRINDPNRSEIQILGTRSRDPSSRSTHSRTCLLAKRTAAVTIGRRDDWSS